MCTINRRSRIQCSNDTELDRARRQCCHVAEFREGIVNPDQTGIEDKVQLRELRVGIERLSPRLLLLTGKRRRHKRRGLVFSPARLRAQKEMQIHPEVVLKFKLRQEFWKRSGNWSRRKDKHNRREPDNKAEPP